MPQRGVARAWHVSGSSITAFVALLLAPKTGKQMRRDLRRKYDDVREVVEDFAEEAKERVKKNFEKVFQVNLRSDAWS